MDNPRAYALLEVKSIDETQRIIVGIATTPTPDLGGDVMEPKGAQFNLPMPLLWMHGDPVGEVFAAKVTAAGIEIKAKIFNISEAGALKDRLDEAWQSVKYKLARGLSIGWKALEAARIQGTGGLHVMKWLWAETSIVVVPMNRDATITSVKSLDLPVAAIGKGRQVPSTNHPGASGTGYKNMKLSEQIAAKSAELKTKSARLEELNGKDTLETTEREERGTVALEVKSLGEDLDALRAQESALAHQAVPVAVKSGDPAPAVIHRVEVKDNVPKGIGFARFIICKMAAYVSQGEHSASAIAKLRYPDMPQIALALKNAVAPITSADGSHTGGTDLVYATNLISEFIEFLRPMTILGKFGSGNIPSLRRVPFNVRITGQTSGGAGYWVGQAAKKPLTKFDFTAVSLAWAKVAAISVVSDELARFSSPSAEGLVRDGLAAALTERLDIDFIDPDKAAEANVSPQSITRGIGATPSAGSDAADVRADIKTLLTGFIAANINPTGLVFIMTNTRALALSLMRNALGQKEFPDMSMNGGLLEGIPVIASQYALNGSPEADMVVLVNAPDIFLSDDGQVTVDMSREASLQMDDAPSSGAFTSMFQSNLIALRAERYINWARRREAAVAYIIGCTWGEGSPVA